MELLNVDNAVVFIRDSEKWLMRRILKYAHDNDFTKYTSTLEEAWRASIVGLSDALIKSLEENPDPFEFGPDDDFTSDPVAAFGVLEAQRHRARGVPLGMFMGLMKYYRQSYIDLVDENPSSFPRPELLRKCILRFFDRVEIAYCVEWCRTPEQGRCFEKEIEFQAMPRHFQIYLKRMHDISKKFSGIAVIFSDVTDLKRVESELLRLATYDNLSGLINRRRLDERLKESMHLAERYNLPLSLCICDIDEFKNINDTYGHIEGDDVIKVFAEIIRNNIRDSDYAGRYGGDEFCIVFPNTEVAAAQTCLERIRAAFEQYVFSLPGEKVSNITASFGLAEYRLGSNGTEFFAAADRNLYEAKGQGRNRIISSA